jgi:hypothetical protein
MAIITDPDNLSQGGIVTPTDAVWGSPTGTTVTITSVGSELPTLGAGDFFEVRDHPDAENNGLYVESGGSPGNGSITADKLTGSDPIANGTGQTVRFFGNTTTEKNVMFDVQALDVLLLEQGLLTADGVNKQALYSFGKEEWKDDADLIKYPFPMFAIDADAGKYEIGSDGVNFSNWGYRDIPGESIRTRKLLRNAGWREYDSTGVLLQEYAGIFTLGDFEDTANDLAYYRQGFDPADTAAAIDFDFAGPVNEAILIYELATPEDGTTGFDFVDGGGGDDSIDRNDGGSWITEGYKVGARVTVRDATTSANDGTYVITAVTTSTLSVETGSLTADTADQTARFATNFRYELDLFLRVRDLDPNGKTFSQANLASGGYSILGNRVFSFPLGNATDLDISETDANIGSQSPYTEIEIRYFDQAFSRDVDQTGTPRDFGIVIDVGTHSGVDGSSAATTTFTTTEGGMGVNAYAGGTLEIHEGTDAGSHSIVSNTATTFTLGSALTASESNLSFTAQLSTPVVATKGEIYEKVQYLLRQSADIDATDQTVAGDIADALAVFVGPDLLLGRDAPNNPNGGGSGVIIEGFDANDTNNLYFFDNTTTQRSYPFVAAGSINFSQNLVDDPGPAKYWMFYSYTERFTNTGFGLSTPIGDTANLDSSTTDLTAELANGDYIFLSGFADADLDGLYVLTSTPSGTGPWSAAVRRVDGTTLTAESAGASVSLDKNPIDSPDAILVDNNSGADITGTIGATSIGFDYDYDNNVQGGRTAGTPAAVEVRAIGLDDAQFAAGSGIITASTGISISVVSATERNYLNA